MILARLCACDADSCTLAECHSRHYPIKVDPELPLAMLHCVEIGLRVHAVTFCQGRFFSGLLVQESVVDVCVCVGG